VSDTGREWQQQSLRDVRALLDKEEAERRGQKRTFWILAFSLLPLIGLLAVVVLKGPLAAAGMSDSARVACESSVWARKSSEREREIRAANPGIAPGEVGKLLRTEARQLESAAAQECRKGGALK